MPYVSIKTVKKLDDAQKDKIKAELGRLMPIIPTKTEAGLMVDFSGDHTFYKAGNRVDGAFVELRLYRKSELEPKKKYTAELLKFLCEELGLKKECVYMNIMEFENCGSNGELH